MTQQVGKPKLIASSLCFDYRPAGSNDPTRALDGVDLTIEDGEFFSIVGPSGAGKSTFLGLVEGHLVPTSGRLTLDGVAITAPGPERAVVFQDASLFPWRTVLGNVSYGLECRGIASARAKELARPVLELVGLSGWEHYHPHALSGGMQQRVNLARALAMDPELLLMDEPFASLDAQTRDVMQEQLLEIWRQANKTVLFVTHQISEAVFLSDRVAVFSGRPACVKAVISIDIPRPRNLKMKRDPAFLDYEDRIWSLIETDVRKTVLAGVEPDRPLDETLQPKTEWDP